MIHTGLAHGALELVDAQPSFTLTPGAESGIPFVQ